MARWRTIPGYEGYYKVSTRGKVKSVARIVRRGNVLQPLCERILSTQTRRVKNAVYAVVALCKNGRTEYRYVHRLVAEAFVPNPENLPEVNHKDLNKRNNRARNLEWVSSSRNKKHAVANGVLYNPNPRKGEEAGSALLTWKKVRKIRRLAKKWTQRRIARRFGITQANVSCIVLYKTWKE